MNSDENLFHRDEEPMRLYFDMNIYKRSFDDQTQIRIKLETMAINIIFQLIEQNQYDVYWSFILDYENSPLIHP